MGAEEGRREKNQTKGNDNKKNSPVWYDQICVLCRNKGIKPCVAFLLSLALFQALLRTEEDAVPQKLTYPLGKQA